MTFKNVLVIASHALFALALSLPASAAKQRHNFVLLVPETMQAANVNESTTPALARLRGEGVYFINSYSGFPDLTSRKLTGTTIRRPGDGPAALVGVDGYANLYLHGPARDVQGTLIETIERSAKANQPFLIVCTIRGLQTSVFSPRRPLRAGSAGTEGAAGALLYNTDQMLAAIEKKLMELGLYEKTNIIVAAEQGRSTIWKQSKTSRSVGMTFGGVPTGTLPPGFLAIELMRALLVEDGGLSLFDTSDDNARLDWWAGKSPSHGSAIIGVTATSPYLTIEARGGYDLIFLPRHLRKKELQRRARSIVSTLGKQDYVSGLFVNEKRVGKIDGALSLRHLGGEEGSEEGLADIVVSFTSAAQGCGHPTICTIAIADTPVQEGNDLTQGFSRAETSNFIAARGPDFQKQLISRVPASTLDVVVTVRGLVGERPRTYGIHKGRELTESLRGNELGPELMVRTRVVTSEPLENGDATEVHIQSVAGVDYLVAAGSPGRSVGVPERPEKIASRWQWPRWRRFSITISPD